MKNLRDVAVNLDRSFECETANSALAIQESLIHDLFPNLPPLDKFVLMSVLEPGHVMMSGDQDNKIYFNHTQIDKDVRQYIDYLSEKEKLERRKLEDRTKKRAIVPFYQECHFEF